MLPKPERKLLSLGPACCDEDGCLWRRWRTEEEEKKEEEEEICSGLTSMVTLAVSISSAESWREGRKGGREGRREGGREEGCGGNKMKTLKVQVSLYYSSKKGATKLESCILR